MRNILVYRDVLIPPSEQEFMRRQYLAFDRLAPHWLGCKFHPQFDRSTIDATLVGGPGLLQPLRQAAFKQFGVVPQLREARRLSPALIHAQFGRGGALALPLAKQLGIPLAVTFHGGDAFKDKHYRRQVMPTIFQRRWEDLVAYASLFVCVAPGVREKLIERGVPAGKLEVIAIGADGVLAAVPPRQPKHLLFAGRFVSKKGVLVLVEAVRLLRQRGVGVPLLMAGAGPLLAAARDRAGDIPDVTFCGWLDPSQLRQAMTESYALVVPSVVGKDGDQEGLPSVIVEALAVACPVAVSDQAGVTGLPGIDAAGVMTTAGNSAALADALETLVKNTERRTLLETGALALAQRSFSARTQSRLLEDSLLALIDQS